jgi:hypothetical protein
VIPGNFGALNTESLASGYVSCDNANWNDLKEMNPSMTGQLWLIIGVSTVAVLGLSAFIVTQTSWFKVRKYAMDVKKVFDTHKVQQKAEAVQALGQNANPVVVKKPLRELINTYQGMIADLEKIKAPAKAQVIHTDTLVMHRESLSLYQMAAVGGFRQKAMQEKQRKLQNMERALQTKMEKLYGKMKPAKK